MIFPNYEKYSNVNKPYSNFFHKLIEVVNKIAPLKTVRIRNISSEWFDRKIAEKLRLRNKLLKKFKSSRLNIDWEIHKEARNDIQRLTKYKRNSILRKILVENIVKPKKLRKTLKSVGLPNKKLRK